MPDFPVSFDSCMEAARLASSRGDRLGAEQSIKAAIAVAEASSTPTQLAAALIKLGELKRDAGMLSEAEELFGRALEITEGTAEEDDSSLVAALTSLAAMRTARGAGGEAEVLLNKALGARERRLGREHPDLVVLLNDLSRLYLKRSAFALAEPLLLRLHAIKRAKGEEHPEVATVLASLATVREALGDHDAAEQLWRRVLAIRERTLAPNHFAIATAVEHLAETCSARGKVAEALRLFHRALAMREMTLGAGHPSLRVSRERIADLQLQGEDMGLHDDALPSSPTADWRGLAVVEPTFERGTPVPQPGAHAAAQQATIAAAPAAYAQQATIAPAPAAYAQPRGYAQPQASELEVPVWAEGVPAQMAVTRVPQPMAIVFPTGPSTEIDDDEDFDMAGDQALVGGRMHNISASLGNLLQQRRTQVAASVVAVVLIAAAASATLRARPATGSEPFVRPVPAQQYVAGGVTALPDSLTARSSAGEISSASPPSRAVSPESPVSGERARGGSSAPERPAPKPSGTTASLPSAATADFSRVPGVSTAQLDSAMRAGAASTVNLSGPTVSTPAFTASDKPFGTVTYAVDPARQAPPRLIGALPRVAYPQSLRATGRESNVMVIVEFTVDTLGRPDMATLGVVRSDNALLTDAVRKVVPSMRFAPGQQLGKKVRSKVQVPFTFTKD